MVAAPVSGYLLSNRMGEALVLFGAVALPSVVGADHAQMQLLERIHLWINYSLMAVAGLHITAALKHHFVGWPGCMPRPTRRRPRLACTTPS